MKTQPQHAIPGPFQGPAAIRRPVALQLAAARERGAQPMVAMAAVLGFFYLSLSPATSSFFPYEGFLTHPCTHFLPTFAFFYGGGGCNHMTTNKQIQTINILYITTYRIVLVLSSFPLLTHA